ncbi:MAG: 3-keto-disaccharide hydrolase [Pirellulaceae bacterium]
MSKYFAAGAMIFSAALTLISSVVVFPTTTDAQQIYVQRGAPIPLFDGHSTAGWSKAGGEPHPGWIVEDGTLHRAAGGGDLYHYATFRDFELHFQWKIAPGGNSGVKYRVRKYGNAQLGCEYQLLDDEGASEPNKAACLYDVYEAHPAKRPAAADVWHRAKIVVCGNRIEHWLDGVKVVDAITGSQDWDERVARSKFRDREGFGENREGRIFLQDHGNHVWFRHIVLIPLYCDVSTQPVFVQTACPCPVPRGCCPPACCRRRGVRCR